jgi:hypothetical protein
MTGEAPYDIHYRWVYGPPMPAGLDPQARKAMIRKRVEEILADEYLETGSSAPAQGDLDWEPVNATMHLPPAWCVPAGTSSLQPGAVIARPV